MNVRENGTGRNQSVKLLEELPGWDHNGGPELNNEDIGGKLDSR